MYSFQPYNDTFITARQPLSGGGIEHLALDVLGFRMLAQDIVEI